MQQYGLNLHFFMSLKLKKIPLLLIITYKTLFHINFMQLEKLMGLFSIQSLNQRHSVKIWGFRLISFIKLIFSMKPLWYALGNLIVELDRFRLLKRRCDNYTSWESIYQLFQLWFICTRNLLIQFNNDDFTWISKFWNLNAPSSKLSQLIV